MRAGVFGWWWWWWSVYRGNCLQEKYKGGCMYFVVVSLDDQTRRISSLKRCNRWRSCQLRAAYIAHRSPSLSSFHIKFLGDFFFRLKFHSCCQLFVKTCDYDEITGSRITCQGAYLKICFIDERAVQKICALCNPDVSGNKLKTESARDRCTICYEFLITTSMFIGSLIIHRYHAQKKKKNQKKKLA